MNKFKVKRGMRFGKENEFGPGDNVVLSPEEAAGFLDKLEPVDDEEETTDNGQPTTETATTTPTDASAGSATDDEQPTIETATTTPTDASTGSATSQAQPTTDGWAWLDPKVVAVLEKAGVTPAMARTMTDDELLSIDSVGPATLIKIRSALGNAG